MLVGLGLLGASAAAAWRPMLIWNASASVPRGLYSVQAAAQIEVGDLVLVQPPAALAGFLAERGYLARGVPLLKQVAALPPQAICSLGDVISIDGQPVADLHQVDRLGRPLPSWAGCQVLGPDQVLLLNAARPDSLDGRYFGPLPRAAVVGRLRPLWVTSER
jgi:conjugative transfer signal peptidase TraF